MHFVELKQVEMFVDAIEASANNRPVRTPVAARELTDTNDTSFHVRKKITGAELLEAAWKKKKCTFFILKMSSCKYRTVFFCSEGR